MIFGYARVSSRGQARGGFSLEEQQARLLEHGVEEVFVDVFSGVSCVRPEFSRLLETVVEGDLIVVCKLDRFARSTREGLEVVSGLLARGVRVHVLNMGVVDDSPTGKLILGVMFAFAEFERDMIVQRTLEGKSVARLREDYREGRPKCVSDEEFRRVYGLGLGVKESCVRLGIARSTWYKKVRELV